MFDPFYRTLGSDQVGSGLGLSIVKAVADRLDAEIELGFSDEVRRSGLRVRVLMPVGSPISNAPRTTEVQRLPGRDAG